MPEILSKNEAGKARAKDIIVGGGVVVFPTDTAYGLGVNGCDARAVEKIFEIKGRSSSAPISIAVADVGMAKRYGVFSESAIKIAEHFLPGALTLIVPARERLPKELLAGGTTIGFRIPDTPWILDLIHACNTPITATSANKSGDPAHYSVDGAMQSLVDTWHLVDAVIDGGVLPQQPVSTVVECIGDTVRVVREGPVSGADIEKVLH